METKRATTTSQEGIFHFRQHKTRLKRESVTVLSSLAFLGKIIQSFLFQLKFLPLQRLKHCRTHEFLLSAQIRVCLRLRVITVNCSAPILYVQYMYGYGVYRGEGTVVLTFSYHPCHRSRRPSSYLLDNPLSSRCVFQRFPKNRKFLVCTKLF